MNKFMGFIMAACLVLIGCGNDAQKQPQTTTESAAAMETAAKQEEAVKPFETVENQTTAKESEPPAQTQSLAEPDVNEYVKIRDYIPDIVIDLKYATEDNFTGQVIYDFNEAYLHYGTVLKLMKVQEQLREQGYGLKIWDAYRPFYAQERLWEIYPNPTYVADPAKGRRGHNLGNTVDITLVYLDGLEVPMPTGFDDFSTRADRDYSEIEEDLAANAMLLQETMYANGFTGYKGEWWDFTDTEFYADMEDFVPQE